MTFLPSFALLVLVLCTWCLWVVAAAAQQAVERKRQGLPQAGVRIFPVIPIVPLGLWGLSFVVWPWGAISVWALHVVLLVLFVISIVRDRARLR